MEKTLKTNLFSSKAIFLIPTSHNSITFINPKPLTFKLCVFSSRDKFDDQLDVWYLDYHSKQSHSPTQYPTLQSSPSTTMSLLPLLWAWYKVTTDCRLDFQPTIVPKNVKTCPESRFLVPYIISFHIPLYSNSVKGKLPIHQTRQYYSSQISQYPFQNFLTISSKIYHIPTNNINSMSQIWSTTKNPYDVTNSISTWVLFIFLLSSSILAT